MQRAKKMRLGSSDTWPPSNDVDVDEGPLILFPEASKPSAQPNAVLLDGGIPYTGEVDSFDVDSSNVELSQLAVIKINRDVFRAVQLKSKTAVVYIVISADVERGLIQKHIRMKDRKVNYRLWLDNSMAQKKPQSQTDRSLFGNVCFLSTPLCDQLKHEKLVKLERKPRVSSKTDTVSVRLSIDTEIALSAADAIALLSGAKRLVLSDKGKNELN